MGHAYFYKTAGVLIASGVGTTFTHSLGVAPKDYSGGVIITMKTSTGVVYVLSSTSQLVVIASSLDNAAIDLEVIIYHSIQY